MRGVGWKQVAAVATVLLCAGLPAAWGSSVGINFTDSGDENLGAAESAGAPGYAQVNWNNLGRWGQGVAVNGSDGAASGITVTWDSNNTWRLGIGFGTPDYKLMNGYVDATGVANLDTAVPYNFWDNANKPEVCARGVSAWLAAQGAPSYNVVVYTDGDETSGRVSEYWLQEPGDSNDPPTALGGILTPQVFVKDVINFSGTYIQAPLSANSADTAAEANMIVFTGLTADSFILKTEEISGSALRATINGMQIVAVPEPASIGLFLLAAMGLLARRRAA
ncbi:MAG: PEP-CTERM sorting domain-containing protein [Phycisphaerae bacterium]|nr:PEP-CTERM sorting domain-containing protein [Phycisphaerae bacterium]